MSFRFEAAMASGSDRECSGTWCRVKQHVRGREPQGLKPPSQCRNEMHISANEDAMCGIEEPHTSHIELP
ncbi:hypothetical protein TWF217_012016 [Orbilia oligospora]|nr:hypothetical protein TWF217_012016 [Orbilia oligospora]KAF3243297.1 hypothetical protein TWF128_010273 [Orbilia oligospora]